MAAFLAAQAVPAQAAPVSPDPGRTFYLFTSFRGNGEDGLHLASTIDWVEGPSAIQIDGYYLVYFDHYARPQYYGAVRSRDLAHWEDCSTAMSFPAGHRHGTVLPIPTPVAQKLLQLQ